MAKLCRQKEHKWSVIQDFPRRFKCATCNAIGKIYKSKILPLKDGDTMDDSKRRKLF